MTVRLPNISTIFMENAVKEDIIILGQHSTVIKKLPSHFKSARTIHFTRGSTWLTPNLKEKVTDCILSLADLLLWQHPMPLATIRHIIILTVILFQLWHKTPLMPKMYIPIRNHILVAFPPLSPYYSASSPNKQALFHMCGLPCNVLWSQAHKVMELWLWIPHHGQTSHHHMTNGSPNLILRYRLKNEL